MMRYHEPVMVAQLLEAMKPHAGGKYIDATLGDGGHTLAILEASVPDGRVLAIERDPDMAERAKKRLESYASRLTIVRGSFADIAEIARLYDFIPADGIVLDLGVALWHFTESTRGFSFRTDAPLDMRFDPTTELTAEKIVNTYPKEELERIIVTYGEEKNAARIASAIMTNRPITTTHILARIIERAIRGSSRGLHPATRTFQALRIAVNGELDAIEMALPQAIQILRMESILAIFAYHSLEDRIVKRFFKEEEKKGILGLRTSKPIKPDAYERMRNPRIRSVKFRAAARLE